MLLTHAYALWAANVLLAVFAPAFPLSFHDRKFARSPPKPIASVVSGHCKKRKEQPFMAKLLLDKKQKRRKNEKRFYQHK